MKNGLTYVDHPTSLGENNPCSCIPWIYISPQSFIQKYSIIQFSYSGVNCNHSIRWCGRGEGTPYFFGDSMCHRFDPSFSRQANARMVVFPCVACQFLWVFCIVIFCGLGWALSHGG